jgi:hypothetical protein
MKSLVQAFIYLGMGYIVGLLLSAPGVFSMTLSLTLWSNIMVYVYLLLWPLVLILHFMFWGFLVVVFLLLMAITFSTD